MSPKKALKSAPATASRKGNLTERGQQAVEFLVTYGWMFAAIGIAILVLASLGLFNPTSFLSSNHCTGFSDFYCQDFSIDRDGNLTITLENRLPFDVIGLNVTIGANQTDSDAAKCVASSTMAGSSCACVPQPIAAAGAAKCRAFYAVPPGKTGDYFDQFQLTVDYINSGSGFRHTDSAIIAGKYE